MAGRDLNIEDIYLEKAREEGLRLRLSLSNRERIAGVLLLVGRYDIDIEAGGQVVTIPKKEVSHISHASELIPEASLPASPEEISPTSKSRVQDEFLNRYIKEKTLALLKMVNGDEFRGVVAGYDGFTIALRTNHGQALLYKHGIFSIGPGYRRRPGGEQEKKDAA